MLYKIVAVTFVLIFNCASLLADGKFIFVKGEVLLKRGKDIQKKLKVGAPVKNGDMIQTKKDSLAIIKSENTTIKVIEDSVMMIEFPEDKVANITLGEGGAIVNYLRGKLHDKMSKGVTVTTKSASLAVRGTKFMVYSKGDDYSLLDVNRGHVAFKGTESSQNLVIGEKETVMTNAQKKTIAPSASTLADTINWETENLKVNLAQPASFFQNVAAMWESHKHDEEVKWEKYKSEQVDLWKEHQQKSQEILEMWKK